MENRRLTCIVCPRGCEITVEFSEDGKIAELHGNACARGATYAERECTHPERTVTTTVRTADGGVVSVRTRTPVPRDAVFSVMAALGEVTAPADLSVGDVVAKDVAGTGVDVIATERRHPRTADPVT